MTRPRLAALFTALALLLSAGPALGQSATEKYGPKKFSTSELIDFGTYQRSPLKLPWKIKRTEQVPEANHINFEHYLEADFETVRKHFDEAYANQKKAVKFKRSSTPKGAPRGLRVLGTAETPNSFNYTLGNKGLRRHFSVKLKKGTDETVLVFQNLTLSLVFGGGVPKRAPFKPVDADPVPLAD